MNKQFKLAARPVGMAQRSDFEYLESAIPEPGEGELLVRVSHISLDPAMRGWMNAGKSYIAPVEIGAVMRAGAIGDVIASRNPKFAVGDLVSGHFGVQTHALSNASGVAKLDRKLAPLPKFLGVLGMPGMTAYFGMLDVAQIKAGDVVVVSGAAGAVGQLVGQIAKLKGGKAIGIAGGKDKCDFVVNELGFDACVDYKNGPLRAALKRACPEGIDIYFDNVGGDILDIALAQLRLNARVVICGAISQYNATEAIKGPSNYLSLLVNRARMEGFVVFDYGKRYGEGAKQMAQWMAEGKIKSREDIVHGIETFPETLLKLFSGENFGKLILAV